MADPIGEIPVLITGDYSELQKALGIAESLAKASGLKMATAFSAGGAVGAIVGIGVAAFEAAKEFDEAFDHIRSETGKLGAELKDLEGTFSAVFSDVPASAKQVSEAISEIVQRTGLMGQPLEQLSEQLLNLAHLTGQQIQPLVQSTTRMFGDWSIATGDQTAALDTLFKTAQQTGIAFDRLSDLVVKFGAPMRALGFSFEESAALMGKWEKEGVNLETVLAGLRFALGNFAKAGKEPEQAFKDIVAAIKNTDDETRGLAITFDTFGKRAATDMFRAIKEGRFDIDALVQSIHKSSETIQKATADTRSFGEEWVIFKNRITSVLAVIGTPLLKAITWPIEVGNSLINMNKDLENTFAKFEEWKNKNAGVSSSFDQLNEKLRIGKMEGKSFADVIKTIPDGMKLGGDAALDFGIKVEIVGKKVKQAAYVTEEEAKKMKEALASAFSKLDIKDHTLEIKELRDAYSLLAKSGRLTADQLKDAYGQLQFKLRQLTQDVPGYIEANRKAGEEIKKVLEKTAEDAEKTGKAFEEAWLKWQKGATEAAAKQTPIKFTPEQRMDMAQDVPGLKTQIPGVLGTLSPNLKEAYQDALGLIQAMDRLGIVANKSGEIMSQSLVDFERVATDSRTSIEQVDQAWAKVSGEIDRISKTNLTLAIKLSQEYIDRMKEAGKATGDVYAEEIKNLDKIIHQRELAGKDATKEIIQMDQKIRKMRELTDAARRWGDMLVQIRHEFDKLFDARKLIDTLGGALFDTSKNKELEESIKGLNADLKEAALNWANVQREAAAALEEIVADHAKAQRRIQEDAAMSLRDATIDYRRFVEDSREDLRKAQREGDAEQVREIQKQLKRRAEDYAIYVSDLKKATAQKLQDDQEAQAKETKAVQDNLAQQKAAYDQFVAVTTAKIVEMTDAMTNAFERMGNAFKETLKGFVTEVGKLVASTILQGYLDQLKKKIAGALFPDVSEGFPTDTGGILGGILGKGKSATSPVNVPGTMPPGGDVELPKPGGNADIISKGVGSTIGTALGTGGDVAAIATAAMTAYMLVVLKRMEKDLGRVEVTTRGMLNQLISLQGTFNTWLPKLDHLLDIWKELINVVEILRIVGQSGGFGGGKDIGQQIADAINSRPSTTTNSGMDEILAKQQESLAATDEYNMALQTTASTAYELDTAFGATADGLYYLNEAVTGITGNLPGAQDSMGRSEFDALKNSMAVSNGFSGTQTSTTFNPNQFKGAPLPTALQAWEEQQARYARDAEMRSKNAAARVENYNKAAQKAYEEQLAAYNAIVEHAAALAQNQAEHLKAAEALKSDPLMYQKLTGYQQSALLGNPYVAQLTPAQQGIAMSANNVFGSGVATVNVTAVDPTSRSVTKGIVTGLEEVGIRVR